MKKIKKPKVDLHALVAEISLLKNRNRLLENYLKIQVVGNEYVTTETLTEVKESIRADTNTQNIIDNSTNFVKVVNHKKMAQQELFNTQQVFISPNKLNETNTLIKEAKLNGQG